MTSNDRIAAAPDLAAEVIRLRKWQSETVEWLRWFCENVEESWSIPPAPDLNRLIAEAQGE